MSHPPVPPSAYDAFAFAYDEALGKRFFRAMRKLLVHLLDDHRVQTKTHLDIACGTGLAMEFFSGRGFRSLGLDASLTMLAMARERNQQAVAGDFRALPLRGSFGLVTCLYDSLNHLRKHSDLVATFRAVQGVMDPSSFFIFDMNHPDIYPEVWGSADPFISNGPRYHLEIATTYEPMVNVGRAMVTGWSSIGGRRVEIRERHEQRAYSQNEIVAALAEGGLKPVEILDFDPFNEADALEARTVKMVFVSRIESSGPAAPHPAFGHPSATTLPGTFFPSPRVKLHPAQ